MCHILAFTHTLVRGVMSLEQSRYRGSYKPYVSPLDPCPPIKVKKFVLPPPIFMNFQPPGLEQFSPREALMHWNTLAITCRWILSGGGNFVNVSAFEEEREMMLLVQEADFVVVELTLYTDTHPDD